MVAKTRIAHLTVDERRGRGTEARSRAPLSINGWSFSWSFPLPSDGAFGCGSRADPATEEFTAAFAEQLSDVIRHLRPRT